MASPFSFFRKNQRLWMAALVLVAIVSFVIFPSLQQLSGSGQLAGQNKTLVSWKGGRLGAAQLEKLNAVHAQTYNIFSRLANEVMKAGGRPKVPDFEIGQNGVDIGIAPPAGVEGVIQLKVFAQEAHKRGIVVDDKTVDLFIRNFTDGKISQPRFQEIVNEIAGKNLSKFDMYDFLKDEIAKRLLLKMGQAGIVYSTQALIAPSKNWTNFQKFNERIKIEAFPVSVDEYLEKVSGKPSESELRKIYEAGKDRYPVPSIPEPGFRRRYKADVEYVMANFDTILKEEQDKITDEALQAEYDKRISEGRFKVPVEEFKPTDSKPEDGKPAESKPADDKSDEAKPAETKSEEKGDKPAGTADKPAEPAPKPASDATEKPAESGDKPAEVKEPAATEEAKPAAEEAKEAPKSDSSSLPINRLRKNDSSEVRLVSFLQEEKPAAETTPAPAPAVTEDAAKEVKKEAEPSTNPALAKEAAKEDAKTEEKPIEVKDPEMKAESEKPAAEEAKPADAKPADSTPVDQKTSAATAEKPMRVQTLDEVKDQLKREMALAPTRAKMDELIEKVRKPMLDYYTEKQFYDAQDPKARTAAKPTKPDLKALAEEAGLTYGITGLVDMVSVRDLPIANSFTNFGGMRGMNFAGFSESVLSERSAVGLFQPEVSQGFGTGNYLFWKVEEEQSRVVPFEEARSQVTDAWKLSEARKLAEAAAKKIADQVGAVTEGDIWEKTLDESQRPFVVKPAPFTWLQPIFTGNEGIQLATVEGIEMPSQLFMEKLFSTAAGKTTVVFDSPEKKCYIVKVVERSPSMEELRAQFERSPLNRGVSSLAQQQSSINAGKWFERMIEDLNVDASKLANEMSGE